MVIRKPAAKKPTVKRRLRKPASRLAFWEEIVAIGKAIPRKERAALPRDAAQNFDHYLDGAPRQN